MKFCDFVTNVLLNSERFYSILATIQYFRLLKSAIMDQFVTFRIIVYWNLAKCKSLSYNSSYFLGNTCLENSFEGEVKLVLQINYEVTVTPFLN